VRFRPDRQTRGLVSVRAQASKRGHRARTTRINVRR